MDDSELLYHIEKLVNEEHELMKLSEQGNLTDDQHVRMRALEISLDQCWDLLGMPGCPSWLTGSPQARAKAGQLLSQSCIS